MKQEEKQYIQDKRGEIIVKLWDQGFNFAQIASIFNINRSTAMRVCVKYRNKLKR